jgi:hypothetical protein
MRIRFLNTVLAAVLMAGCSRAPAVETAGAAPAPVPNYAILLERSATGWSAHCEAGCRWTDVTETCAGCDIRLDATGISRGYPARAGTQGFEFVVSAEREGWSAQAVRGVTWTNVSWGCPGTTTCRARVDETGVSRV